MEEARRRRAENAKPATGNLPGVFLMTNSFETGGSERQFVALAQSLDASSFGVHLGCFRSQGAFLEGLGDVPEFRLGGSLYGVQSIRSRFRLGRYLRSSNISIAHSFDFYTNLALIPTARIARIPVVIGSQRQLGDLLTPAQFRTQLAMFRWCDAVVCNSRAAADVLLRRGIEESRLSIIGNGLPDSCFAETEPALPRRPGLLRVGMIARMNSRSKNHRAFLRAAGRIRTEFGNVEFVLAGDGPLREDLEREARELGLDGQVCFLGDRRDISAVLASLDVSVLPSSSESLSNVIIESMAAGVPVVANRVGGNSELLRDGRGILVAPGDEQALTGAVVGLLRDPDLRAELGVNAKKFARSNFTIERMQRAHQELYTELLARKRWRPRVRSFDTRGSAAALCPLRVSIIAASLRYVGGQSVQADLLLQHWRNDAQVHARLVPIDPPYPFGLKWVSTIPVLRTIVREPFYVIALWRGLKDADVAHIFSASYWSFLIAPVPALLMARMLGKKPLIHYHSGEAQDHFRRFRSAVPLLRRADLLVVPSGYLVKVFSEFGLKAKAVPNIVDTSQFTFRDRKPLRPHLVCTRGFHPYYSVDVVVRAFAEVQRSFPEARLDLVGKGPAEEEIRALVKELGIPGINFAGVATREQIGKFYDEADIFINASWLDNMPVSILEAFAAGTPVVSTAPEGITYIVEHERTGLLSEPGDPVALAQNVTRLLKDPQLAARLADNGHEESQRYCWEAVRCQWLDVYDSLAVTPGAGLVG